jgi:hypothetical protein
MKDREYRLAYIDPLLGGVEVFGTFPAADDQSACVESRSRMGDTKRRWFLFDDRSRLVVEGRDYLSRFPNADLIFRSPTPGSSEFHVRLYAQTPAGLRWTALSQDPDDGGLVDRVSVLPSIMPKLFSTFAHYRLVVEEDRT